MHSIITVLANRYKIPISGRACGGGDLNQPCWDGKNLATYWVRFEYNDDDVCIVQHRVPISDAELLHEIGHYVAAREEQRDLPEYGLGAVVFTTYHFWDSCPSVVDEVEGFIQEFLAILLEVYWGQLNCLPFVLSYGADWASDWQELFVKERDKYLYGQENESYSRKGMWEALIRFRKLLEAGSI